MSMLSKSPPTKPLPSIPKKTQLQPSPSKSKQIPILSLPHLAETKAPVDHAPVESGMINKPNEASEITATTYLYRIQYRRKVPSGTADAVDLIKNLMARLMQYDQTL